jgi:hypothetical protein
MRLELEAKVFVYLCQQVQIVSHFTVKYRRGGKEGRRKEGYGKGKVEGEKVV